MSSASVVRGFVDGAAEGRSEALRAEGDLLITTGGAITALRLRPAVLLVRAPGVLADPDAEIRPLLTAAGLALQQADPPLADVVALMRAALRGTPWDLWGRGERESVEALERAATGDVDVDLGATAARLHDDLVLADYDEPPPSGDARGRG